MSKRISVVIPWAAVTTLVGLVWWLSGYCHQVNANDREDTKVHAELKSDMHQVQLSVQQMTNDLAHVKHVVDRIATNIITW